MRIEINTGRTRKSGEDIVAISRASINFGREINNVCHQLRQISQMDVCRKALFEQEAALDTIAVRLANMGESLFRISETYNMTELRNTDRLEECGPVQTVSNTTIYSVQQEFKGRINRILYQ